MRRRSRRRASRQFAVGPRKQRHTIERICQRLAVEHGFTDASYSTVRNYVARRRPQILAEAREGRGHLDGMVPQVHPPGEEAEVVLRQGGAPGVRLAGPRGVHGGPRRGVPGQATQRWHIERTNAWHNAFNRLQRCYERKENVVHAFFDLADAIITVRSLIRQAWTLYRWDTRPAHRP